MKIGVFDSGIGGAAVAKELQTAFPTAAVKVVDDERNVPYGDRSPEEVIRLTNAAIQPLLKDGCDIVVIACNTATALAIEYLRNLYPDKKFIGIEPMIKAATAQTKNNLVIVCATQSTLNSPRYLQLLKRYASHLDVIEPDCREWAIMIQQDQINQKHIQDTLEPALRRGADVIVLGCTHYHWIKKYVQSIAAGRAVVLEPSEAIARRVAQLFKVPLPPQ